MNKNWFDKLFIDEAKPAMNRHSGGSGGDSIVVDVDELPTENVDESKIYRVSSKLYIGALELVLVDDTPITLTDILNNNAIRFGDITSLDYYIVDELPSTGNKSVESEDDGVFTTLYHIYIVRESGVPYVTFDGTQWVTGSDGITLIPLGEYNGTITDISQATNTGYYTLISFSQSNTLYGISDEANNKTVYEHNGTEWVECSVISVIDVEELPTENVDPNKIYRIVSNTEAVSEPYITSAYLTDVDLPISYTEFAKLILGYPPLTQFVYHYSNTYDDVDWDNVIDSGTTGNIVHVYITLDDGATAILWNGQWQNAMNVPESDIYTYRGVVSDISEIDINQPGYWHLISEGGLVHTYGVSKIGDRTKFYEHDGEWTEYISKEISDELEQQISDRDNQIDALDIKIGVMNFCITDEQYKKFLNVASFVRSYTDDEFKLISINDKTIDSITIPQCFYSIEPYAFDGCASLTEVILPEGVRFVDNGAFNNCTALEYIKFPSTFEQSGFYPYSYPYVNPFMGCTALQVMDFSYVTKVIRCPRSDSIPSTCKIIVPDELYDKWIDSQYGWKDHKDNIIKASEAT